jgi:hypothetical protein
MVMIVKFTLEQATKDKRGSKAWYPLYRRQGWPRGRSGRVRKISPVMIVVVVVVIIIMIIITIIIMT